MDIIALHKLVSAVCPIDGISVGDEADKSTWRIDFDASAAADQKSAAEAAVAAYVPTPTPSPPVTITYALMRSRLTDAEREAILTACRSSWQIDDWVRLAQADGEINIASDTTAAAKAAMVAAGLLTQARADAVLAPP